MDFYFVYSSGGGAGDWNGIDRIFKTTMPNYFKNHILIKFGDIFFNHRSSDSVIKRQIWASVDDAKSWLISNTNDSSLRNNSDDMIMDVGTTKIVSFLTSQNANIDAMQLIARFNRIMYDEGVLNKYCNIIKTSQIHNAVTFDIPNLFKVRNQSGSIQRNIFDEANCSKELITSCADYANYIYNGTNKNPDDLLTIININWSKSQINNFLNKLSYTPTKLAIGGAAFKKSGFSEALQSLGEIIDLKQYKRVHFLGCGGLDKAKTIKQVLGNNSNFSVDNTTPYNRSIDGSIDGSAQSCYYDYSTGKLYRIKPQTINQILDMHKKSCNIAYFSYDEMKEILNGILQHQSKNSSQYTYDCRAKLIIHNFDVYRYKAN